MLPGDFLQVSNSRSSVAQGIDDNSKGAGPRDRFRVSPALGATLVTQISGSDAGATELILGCNTDPNIRHGRPTASFLLGHFAIPEGSWVH
jgi:hypothetical protein